MYSAAVSALSEPGGLLADVSLTAPCRLERLGDPLALSVTERWSLGSERLGLLPQGEHGRSKVQERLLRMADHVHQDPALTTALAAKAPQDFVQRWVERLGWPREDCGAVAARLRAGGDERQRFFALSTGWSHRCRVGCLVHAEQDR